MSVEGGVVAHETGVDGAVQQASEGGDEVHLGIDLEDGGTYLLQAAVHAGLAEHEYLPAYFVEVLFYQLLCTAHGITLG